LVNGQSNPTWLSVQYNPPPPSNLSECCLPDSMTFYFSETNNTFPLTQLTWNFTNAPSVACVNRNITGNIVFSNEYVILDVNWPDLLIPTYTWSHIPPTFDTYWIELASNQTQLVNVVISSDTQDRNCEIAGASCVLPSTTCEHVIVTSSSGSNVISSSNSFLNPALALPNLNLTFYPDPESDGEDIPDACYCLPNNVNIIGIQNGSNYTFQETWNFPSNVTNNSNCTDIGVAGNIVNSNILYSYTTQQNNGLTQQFEWDLVIAAQVYLFINTNATATTYDLQLAPNNGCGYSLSTGPPQPQPQPQPQPKPKSASGLCGGMIFYMIAFVMVYLN